MDEKILIITEKSKDVELLKEILGARGFCIEVFTLFHKIEDILHGDAYAAIIADYALVGEMADAWVGILQEKRSRACFILYGEATELDSISGLLQKGAYEFIPRNLLSERIYDSILGGLENRKAFIEILGMIDEIKGVNKRLKKEKDALKTKNQELRFLNRLSSEVAYDLNWERILPRILDADLFQVIDPEVLGLLYRIGSRWNLSLYVAKQGIDTETIQRFKEDVSDRFFLLSQDRVSPRDMIIHIYPSNVKLTSPPSLFSSKSAICRALKVSKKPLGMLLIIPKNGKALERASLELVSTISNILAMSLKNAQEYYCLKEMTVTDNLTGIYNYKGFKDFLQREFKRARRHEKVLSLIMIDVDNFKAINDSFGHQAGDHVLRELAKCLKKSVRGTDIVARYGGDEFTVLLPETELGKVGILIERIVCAVENHPFQWEGGSIDVEISYGISATGELQRSEKERALIERADNRLYAMKKYRNGVYPMLSEHGHLYNPDQPYFTAKS
jgi:diguanylate cyclase (GGDEF)-like protein